MAPIAGFAAVALQGFGALSEGLSRRDAGRANAVIAEQNAQFVEQQTEEDIDRFSEDFKRIQATVKSAVAGRGLQIAGTAIEILRSNAVTAQRDVEQIRLAGTRQAKILRAGGKQQLDAAGGALTSGLLRAGGLLISGGAGLFEPAGTLASQARSGGFSGELLPIKMKRR